MKRLIGYMAALCLLALMVGCGGITSTGTLAYISNSSGTGFTVFNVNTDATLTKSSISPQNTPAKPKVLEFSANGKWAYFLDAAGVNLYGYLRAGNGTLTTQIGVFPLSSAASAMVISPNSTFIYVALPGFERLAIYAIDGGTGNLTQQGSSLQTSFAITQLIMAPGGGVLYGLSPSQGQVLSYTLNSSSGFATQVANQPAGTSPTYMVLSANGAYMYVLSLDTTGFAIPAPVGGAPAPPSCGKTLPTILQTPNIYGFNLSSSGAFTAMQTPFNENQDPVTGCFPAAPIAGATSNDTRFLFVANRETHNISSFKISSSTGELNEVLNSSTTVNGVTVTTGSPFDCGSGCTTPAFLAVPKANNGLYLLDPGTQGQPGKIFQFKINQNNGTLRAQNPASVPAEGNPTWITIR